MRPLRSAMAFVLSAALLLEAGPAHAAFSDVPGGYWSGNAISYVAEARPWMQDYGTAAFHPEEALQRKHLARALIRAFDPSEQPGPTFTDLPPNDPYYPSASAAVKLGWMSAPGGAFSPTNPVTKIVLDHGLIQALGLQPEVNGLNDIHTVGGHHFDRPPGFAALVLAHQLRLHKNHGSDSEVRELWPSSAVKRADAAFALHRAATAASWRLDNLARYRSVVLPAMNERKTKAVQFALNHVGSPYVYAGEWHQPTPETYCCGDQAQGGFDCSGFVWWVVRKPDSTWSNAAIRPYEGWRLKQRSSRHMAKAAKVRKRYRRTRPMNLMFFDGDRSHRGWRGVDHVGIFLGKGWMIHSASSIDGVSIEWVKDGWYREHFKWSRGLRRS